MGQKLLQTFYAMETDAPEWSPAASAWSLSSPETSRLYTWDLWCFFYWDFLVHLGTKPQLTNAAPFAAAPAEGLPEQPRLPAATHSGPESPRPPKEDWSRWCRFRGKDIWGECLFPYLWLAPFFCPISLLCPFRQIIPIFVVTHTPLPLSFTSKCCCGHPPSWH